jgi:carbon-monoxide dehydrogenase small subunit
MEQASEVVSVTVTVNGRSYRRQVDARMTAADFLRERLELTGTHVGCEHGVCGACTILVDGRTVRSCILFAPQLDGATVTTVEGLEPSPGELHPLQEAFRRRHALQCGFCTAGFLLTAYEFLQEVSEPDESEIRDALSGNTCRCTGYQGIVDAVALADRTWVR